MKSFRPKDGSGEPRPRRTERPGGFPWAEALQPDARLDDRSGRAALSQGMAQEAKLCFMGHALMENRDSLVVDACANG